MYFWGLFLLMMPLALLVEMFLPIPLFGMWGHLPWVSGLVVYYALHQKLRAACCAALLGGILVDGFSVGQPGTALLAYGVMVYIADRFRRQIVPDAVITAIVFGLATSLGVTLLRLGVLWNDGFLGLSPLRLAGKILFALVSGGMLTPLLCIFMQKLLHGLDLVATEEEGQHVAA